MESLNQTAKAIRRMESRGSYNQERATRVNGKLDYKVGAYGMLKSRWPQLAEAAGYQGADWRDPKAQDTVAREYLSRAYEELEDWNLSAVAFRYGMPAARAMKQRQATSPKDIEATGYKQIGGYLRKLEKMDVDTAYPVDPGKLPPKVTPQSMTSIPDRQAPPVNQNQTRAGEVVRTHLIGQRDALRKRRAAPAEEVNDGGNEEQLEG